MATRSHSRKLGVDLFIQEHHAEESKLEGR